MLLFDLFEIACEPGYYGINCNNKCIFPSYGIRCQLECRCKQSICHHSTGCGLFGNLFRNANYYSHELCISKIYTTINKKNTQNIAIIFFYLLPLLKNIVSGVSTVSLTRILESSTTSGTKEMKKEQKANKKGFKIF